MPTPRDSSCLAEPLNHLRGRDSPFLPLDGGGAGFPANPGSRQQASLLPTERTALGLGIRAPGVSCVQAGLPRAGVGHAHPSLPEDFGPCSPPGLSFRIFKIFIYLYLFLAVLGLRFCARAFSSCGKRGPLFITVRGPLTIAASLVAEHKLQMRRLSSCGSRA